VPLSAAKYHRLPRALLYDKALLDEDQLPAVLKTAFLPSASVHQCPRKMESHHPRSTEVRWRLPPSDRMAVNMAVRTATVPTEYRGTEIDLASRQAHPPSG